MKSFSIDGVHWQLDSSTVIATGVRFNPSICKGTPGYVAAWFSQSMIGGSLYPSVSFSSDGVLWSAGQSLGVPMLNIGSGYAVSVAANNQGFMAAFTSRNSSLLPIHARSSFSSDGMTWSSLVQIDDSVGSIMNYTTSVAGFEDTFLAGWVDGSNNAHTSISTNNGMSWSSVAITSDNSVGSEVTVSANSSGFLAAWVDSSGNAHSRFSVDGATWEAPLQIASGLDTTNLVGVALSTSSDVFLAAWQDSANQAYASALQNGVWSDPVQIASDLDAITGSVLGISSVGNKVQFTWTGSMNPYGNLSSVQTSVSFAFKRPSNRRSRS